MTRLVLAALLAQAAPTREVVEVRSAALLTLDGEAREVVGGAWLSDPTLIDVAKELAKLRVEVKVLRETPPTPPMAVVYAASVALLGGLVLGVVVDRELLR